MFEEIIVYISIVFVFICAATIIRTGIDSIRMGEKIYDNRKDDKDD